jgi:cbb3-type cytochrome oxidase subunit 3
MIDLLAEYAKIIGLLGFFAGFILIAVTVMRPGRRHEIEQHAHIPLKEKE